MGELGCKDCTFCFVLVVLGVGVMDQSLEGALDAPSGFRFYAMLWCDFLGGFCGRGCGWEWGIFRFGYLLIRGCLFFVFRFCFTKRGIGMMRARLLLEESTACVYVVCFASGRDGAVSIKDG